MEFFKLILVCWMVAFIVTALFYVLALILLGCRGIKRCINKIKFNKKY